MSEFTPNTEGVFFDLPAEIYHKAPGVSQSMLKDFDEHATPLHFTVRKPKKPTDDMKFGTICHTAVLEPEKLSTAFYVRPDTYPAKGKKGEPDVDKPWHSGATWCEEWVKSHADRPIITKDQEASIPKIVQRVKAFDEFGGALRNGRREVSYFKRDEATGLLLKCRIDLEADANNSERWLFDLKKVQSGGASQKNFVKQVEDYGYHIQAASYLKITGAKHFVFVPFDDSAPYDACQWEPDEEMLEWGAMEYRRILDAYAKCVKQGFFPGYTPGINKLKMSTWEKKRMTQAQYETWTLKVLGGQA